MVDSDAPTKREISLQMGCWTREGRMFGCCQAVRRSTIPAAFAVADRRVLRALCRKDVRLPVQLQRAMAAEAEAAREARAKVKMT